MSVAAHDVDIVVPAGRVDLPGTLTVPANPRGVVLFAHGSGSSRNSPRNVAVAQSLVDRNCATFLFDLLSPQEAMDRRNVFNIELLAERMMKATEHIHLHSEIGGVPIGCFGASTGAAAALVAAADLGDELSAVVSRGGRPGLAGSALPRVTAPTLLLVGSLDVEVLELNRTAQRQMRCETTLVVIPGASHLFEEPGTLEQVAGHAGEWFIQKFAAAHA